MTVEQQSNQILNPNTVCICMNYFYAADYVNKKVLNLVIYF